MKKKFGFLEQYSFSSVHGHVDIWYMTENTLNSVGEFVPRSELFPGVFSVAPHYKDSETLLEMIEWLRQEKPFPLWEECVHAVLRKM
jgi:hypothetical protein